jgi:hypothetical protein
MDDDAVTFAKGPKPGQPPTYGAYAGCYLAKFPGVLASSGASAALGITMGNSLGNPIPPPTGLRMKAPKMLVPGQKWGIKSQYIAAAVFVAIYESSLNSAANSCSKSTGYTPWALQ